MKFAPYVPGILTFVSNTTSMEPTSDSYLRSCLNLIGDMASTYKGDLKSLLSEPGVTRVLTDAKKKGTSKLTKQALKYARGVSSVHIFQRYLLYIDSLLVNRLSPQRLPRRIMPFPSFILYTLSHQRHSVLFNLSISHPHTLPLLVQLHTYITKY